jgi:hypothetical protein
MPRFTNSPAIAALLALVEHGLPFTSADGRAFFRLPDPIVNGSRALPVRSRAFRDWIGREFFQTHGAIPTAHALSTLYRHLEAEASARPHVRIPRRGDFRPETPKLYIDLANPAGQFVEITPDSCSVSAAPEVPFDSSAHSIDLPEPDLAPQPADPLETLRSTLRLDPEPWRRILAWLLLALRNSGPLPIFILRGPGKSLAARILRAVIDPCAAPLLPLPSRASGLRTLARHNFVLAFDGITALSPGLSAALCQLATGIGLVWREHAAADDLVHQWIRRPILLTVDDDNFAPPPTRTLTVAVPDLDESILDSINQALPQILGALCRHLSATLTDPAWLRDAVHVPAPPPPIVTAIQSLLAHTPTWKGTAAQLVPLLRTAPDPTRLSAQIRKNLLALFDAGVTVTFRRTASERSIELASSRPSDSPQAPQSTAPPPSAEIPAIPPPSVIAAPAPSCRTIDPICRPRPVHARETWLAKLGDQ